MEAGKDLPKKSLARETQVSSSFHTLVFLFSVGLLYNVHLPDGQALILATPAFFLISSTLQNFL